MSQSVKLEVENQFGSQPLLRDSGSILESPDWGFNQLIEDSPVIADALDFPGDADEARIQRLSPGFLPLHKIGVDPNF